MKTILITGANGYLASYIYLLNKDKFHWIRMTRKDADLSDPESVKKFVESQDFDICFHTAANATTAVCEENPELAQKINVESTKAIVDVCKEKNAKLIFCSTEQVFNGKENHGPFSEEEQPKSVTVYGKNKIECENYILNTLDDAVILRYSWMMGLSFPGIKASPNLVANVMNAILRQTPTLFTVNEKRCLTYARHLAEQFALICELPGGIYHVASQNDRSTYESARFIAETIGASADEIESYIVPNYDRYADRFRDYRLNADKLSQYGIVFGTFEEDVLQILTDFNWRKK
ncbi:SDR family oxidoreductase [Dubosiella newyorkensis]|uniref:dTDP-4-dehydrorhamnose reductase n=1 Tax=Dubosiella newyorkensis TaxID=1862672 RepID=A0A1U7NNP2_9FIRM|nr:sugar nucleotide-binding protein [Dubosiella newyorkensis]OLU46955.1 dTDP-4-dehydrorhamnose reductase [Dubosiella newyorkensis]